MDDSYRPYRSLSCGPSHAVWSDFCAVAPSPELQEKLKAELARALADPASTASAALGAAREPRHFGFNDGVIIPPEQFPFGTASRAIRAAAAERAPLRGTLRVIVVLVGFSDRSFGSTAAHFRDLFFSTGVIATGSVKEYYREVTGGLVDIAGEVVGPFTLPQTLAWYANGNYGIGKPSGVARAPNMAQDAARAANPSVNFGLYDNDANGFVDAFIVVHAGAGGEVTGNSGDIWSHKWTLPSALAADGKQIYAYLTIPQDAKLGVCAHELGHLLFGFPDLYDTDNSSQGIGSWCLMAGGSWNGGGDTPAHPSAWCKVNQGWASVHNVTGGSSLSIPDVKTSRSVHRLWKNGGGGNEYFLLENRQRTGFDARLPGDGLLVWHIDEAQGGNTDENHYKVALVQADNKRDMELDRNRGDAGDPFPGSSGNAAFNGGSTPSSNNYANQSTCVSITQISASGPTMTARIAVSCKAVAKDLKDLRKDGKDGIKDVKEAVKDTIKDRKELRKDGKELKELRKDVKELAKERKDILDAHRKTFERPHLPGNPGIGRSAPVAAIDEAYGMTADEATGAGAYQDDELLSQHLAMLEARLAMVEAAQGGNAAAQPFIGAELRPVLVGQGQPDDDPAQLQQRMAAGDHSAKRAFDNLPS